MTKTKRATKTPTQNRRHEALVTTYAGLVKQFADRLPHTSAESTLASGIIAGVALHIAAPNIMERLAVITSDTETWASMRASAHSWVDALHAADAVDAAAHNGND